VAGQTDLLEVVFALGTVGRLSHLLHRRKKQTDQDSDDGDNNEQLNQREGKFTSYISVHLTLTEMTLLVYHRGSPT
jgi:hypothetical protein